MGDKIRKLATITGIATLAVACGGPPAEEPLDPSIATGTASSAAAEPTSAAPAEAPEESAAPEDPDGAAASTTGPILATCTPNGSSYSIQISAVDLANAGLTPIAEYSAGDTSPCPSYAFSAPRLRQWFSDDYLRGAADFTAAEDDSNRVGWLDSQTQEIVDLSAVIAGDSGGFSAAAPQHENALFAPDDSLFFYDIAEGSYKWADTTTGEITRSVPEGGIRPTAFLNAVGEPQSVDDMGGSLGGCSSTPAPDGQSEVYLDRDFPVLAWVDDSSAFQIARSGQLTVVKAYPLGGSSNDLLDTSEVGEGCNAAGTPITPESDFEIGTAIVNPEGTHAVFVAGRGTEVSLFRAPLDGSTQPEGIGELDTPEGARHFLIDWEE